MKISHELKMAALDIRNQSRELYWLEESSQARKWAKQQFHTYPNIPFTWDKHAATLRWDEHVFEITTNWYQVDMEEYHPYCYCSCQQQIGKGKFCRHILLLAALILQRAAEQKRFQALCEAYKTNIPQEETEMEIN